MVIKILAIADDNSKLEEIHTYFERHFDLVICLQTNRSFPPQLAMAFASCPTQALQNRVIRTFGHLPPLHPHVGDAAPSPLSAPLPKALVMQHHKVLFCSLVTIVQFCSVRYCMR